MRYLSHLLNKGESRMRAKGSITVFLSLALILIIALAGSLLESARVTVAREIALDDSYLAMQNILAEYQRELWRDYHILFVDASGLQGEEGAVKLGNTYLSKMLKIGKGDYIGAEADFTEIGFKENLTENNCYYFAKQAAAYMKYGAVGSFGKKMINKANILKNTETGTNGLKKALKVKVEAEKKLIELERQKKKLEEKKDKISNEKEKIKPKINVKSFSNSQTLGMEAEIKKHTTRDIKKIMPMEKAEAENKYKKCQENLDTVTGDGTAGGLLGLFLPSGKKISKLKIKGTTWNMVETVKKEDLNLADTGLLILYAKEHFNNFLSESKNSEKREALRYGLEYLIVGKESDEANLGSIANRIFGIRTIAWYAYFLTREDKVAEAEAIAAAVAGALGWSIDEAKKEVTNLLQGGEIPLLPGKAEGVKLKYESFLDSFILPVVKTLPKRMVELIEQNMKVRYYDGFRADSLFAGITAEVRVRVIPRIFRMVMLDGIINKQSNPWESFTDISQSLCSE